MERWAASAGGRGGAIVPLPTLWALAERWYRDRLHADWSRRTPKELQTLLAEVGLSGPFWQLAPPGPAQGAA